MPQSTVVGRLDTAVDAQQAINRPISSGFGVSQVDLSAAPSSTTNDSDDLVSDHRTNTSCSQVEELIDSTNDVSHATK